MAANALDVEPVADVAPPSQPIDSVGRTQASTIYQLQLAFMAARVASLERDLERERQRRRHVLRQYERLVAEREREIGELRRNQDRGLLERLRE